MKTTLFAFIVILLVACSKQPVNEKRLAGVWEATEVRYIFYENNSPVRDSTVENSGNLYLYDDNELENQARNSMAITPAGFANVWYGDEVDALTLMGTTIQELSRRKMVLTEAVSDTSLAVVKVIEYSFKRK